ncbi:hypothetical protein CLOLEP_03653 [[Clostridium] leptum DSM 753]|uniref:Uncharacterized protein n=1 Tax=[Clostridium] leptum DSM 753 TaxID=428125 RepID=A7VYH5_9FIRM|nr:hypothetical protein CLOLEP_03653 [[Clostridium] leptum DSM 753]
MVSENGASKQEAPFFIEDLSGVLSFRAWIFGQRAERR